MSEQKLETVWYVDIGPKTKMFDTKEEAEKYIEDSGGDKIEWRLEKHLVEFIDANYTNYN